MTNLTSKRAPVIRSAMTWVLSRALRGSIMTLSDLRSLSTGKFFGLTGEPRHLITCPAFKRALVTWMAFLLRTIIQKGSSVFNTSHYPRWMLDFSGKKPLAMLCLRSACCFLKQYWRRLHGSSHIRYAHEMSVLAIINGIAY
jgi:hypothetical protein